jgi:O-antigen ligase
MAWIVVALLGSAFFFMPGLLEQFETPKIEIVRLCGLAALAASLIAGKAGRPRRWSALDRAVWAWLLVEILATAFSVAPRVSLAGETRQREGLLTSLALAGLYFAAREAFRHPPRMRLGVDLMLGAGSLVALYALAQVLGHDPMTWRREATFAGGYVRPFATLGHPNLLGLVCAGTATLALALAIAGAGAGRWLRGAAFLLLATVTALTLSRAAWLGLACGIPVAAGLALRGRGAARGSKQASRVAALGAAVGVTLLAILVASTGAWRPIGQRVGELLAGGGASGSSRLEIWRTALAAWRARPWLGHGPDSFEMVFPHFQTAAYWRYEWTGLPFHAHSIYLHTLATRGVLGLVAALAWAMALAAAARAGWRRRAALGTPGLVAGAVALLATVAVAGAFGALGIAGALLVVLVSALLACAGEMPEPAPEPARAMAAGRKPGGRHAQAPARPPALRAAPTSLRWTARIAATIVALATLLYGFTELRASRAGSAARDFMTASPERAVDAAAYATRLSPRDDRWWRMHAASLLWLSTAPGAPAGTVAEAERSARRAVALAPVRAENRVILARALGAREAAGDTVDHWAPAAAEAEYRASLTLAPMDGLTWMEYADHEAILGRTEPALAAARQVAELYPNEGVVQATLAHAWLAAREPDSARAVLERAMTLSWHDAGEREAAEQLREDLRARALRPPPAPLVPGHDAR